MAKSTSARDLLSGGYSKAAGRAMGAPRPSAPEPASNETAPPVPTTPAPTRDAAPAKVAYERVTSYLTPTQKRWLVSAEKGLEEPGLSRSDIVRLAVNRLRDDVAAGLDLEQLLVKQAHDEAAEMPGRRNRGLPGA